MDPCRINIWEGEAAFLQPAEIAAAFHNAGRCRFFE
jgi:hypothetical protein